MSHGVQDVQLISSTTVLTLNQWPPLEMQRAVLPELNYHGLKGLEVEVADPVDDVKQQEGGGKEDPRVGIQLPDVDVNPSFPPTAFFTLLEATEEALTVFAVQALVQAVVIVVVPEQGVAHGYHGPRGATRVQRRVGLQQKQNTIDQIHNFQFVGFL